MEDKITILRLEKRIESLEALAHEPQNYKVKCDEMEKRIQVLENKIRGNNNE